LTDALLDNDVLHKAVRYGLLGPLLESAPLDIRGYHMLGAAFFIISKKLRKHPPGCGADAAIEAFQAAAAGIATLEPTGDELTFAARLELRAQQLNLPLHGGESVLCAVLSRRAYGYLLTGDKQAIGAVEVLLAREPELDAAGKLVCLEQLVLWLLRRVSVNDVRMAVCAQAAVDKALAACFACHSVSVTLEDCCEGLNSYIAALRRAAPTVFLALP
jgi:hypothetical protein